MLPVIRQSWACSPCISKIPSSPAGHDWRQSPPKRKKRGRWLTPAYKTAEKKKRRNFPLKRRKLQNKNRRRGTLLQADLDRKFYNLWIQLFVRCQRPKKLSCRT